MKPVFTMVAPKDGARSMSRWASARFCGPFATSTTELRVMEMEEIARPSSREDGAEFFDPLVGQRRERHPGVGGVDVVEAKFTHLAQLRSPEGGRRVLDVASVGSAVAEPEHVGGDRPGVS